MAADLTGLPDVQFADLDTGHVESAIITMYEGLTNSTLYPGDPVRLFLSTLANIIAQRNILLDFTGKQNMLRYARGAFLEHLGALLQVERLDAVPAKTTMRFTLEAPRPTAILIPSGVRVTADSVTYFATDALLIIPAGAEYGDITATCQRTGKDWNGLLPGQITKAVDPQPFIASVENIEETSGGADIENDESLRNRIRLKPESFTTAGSELAYVYWALTAHPDIRDVAVVSPVPGIVNVFVLLSGGRIPDAGGTEIEAVTNMLSGYKIRPLTDFVTVFPVNEFPIDYTVEWFITPAQSSRVAEIQDGIKAAVAEYEAWQTERIGRDIIPDKLIQLCQGAGAKRIVLDGLDFTRLDQTLIASFVDNPDRINFGGVENE
jgi:phage-related baseplate assembly protein